MDTIEVIICILSYFDVFEIVKCSSINKLFYKASDDQDIWMKIFNHDFCYNGIFSLPTMEQNLCDYKQIYKKYYCMTIRKNLLFKHDYTPKNISCLSQLSPNIKYTAKYYPADIYRGCELYCQASNENYDGIRNIKILLFVKRPFDESLIKLIKMVRISIGKRYIALYNIGLMIMRKLNIIELSETCHETNNLCHEINIQLNTKEHLMFTMNNKSIEIEILFMDDNLLQSACVMMPRSRSLWVVNAARLSPDPPFRAGAGRFGSSEGATGARRSSGVGVGDVRGAGGRVWGVCEHAAAGAGWLRWVDRACWLGSAGGGERADAYEGAGVVAVPGPAGWEVERPAAGVAGQAAGDGQ